MGRKPGRPRKNDNKSKKQSIAVNKESIKTPKSRDDVLSSEPGTSSGMVTLMPEPKRKRGRPKKETPEEVGTVKKTPVQEPKINQSTSEPSTGTNEPFRRYVSEDLSPFKGFEVSADQKTTPAMNSNQEMEKSDENEAAPFDLLFDRLINPDTNIPTRNKTVKTYTNKRKQSPPRGKLLAFENTKNRDSVIQWLNNKKNLFDRVTQTQSENETEALVSLDIPSVSQINKKPEPSKTRRLLRVRSWGPQPKNVNNGKNEVHSIAGDSPLENYHIEEIFTEDEILADNAIYANMEDEYLSTLEDIFESVDNKKRKDASGWDNIKNLTKIIQPRRAGQLPISGRKLEVTNKNELVSKSKEPEWNNNKTFNLDSFENYVSQTIEDVQKDIEESEIIKEVILPPIENVKIIGNNFLNELKKLESVDDNELFSLFATLKYVFHQLKSARNSSASTQTVFVEFAHKQVQAKTEVANADCQTICPKFQHRETQSKIEAANAGTQTEKAVCQNCHNPGNVNESPATASSTPSDIFIPEQSSKSHKLVQDETILDDGLEDFLNFETEDILKGDKMNDVQAKSVQSSSVLACTLPTRNSSENKLPKRVRESPDRDVSEIKRPCNKFISDLSVDFESCMQTEATVPQAMDEESEDPELDAQIVAAVEKYEERIESEFAPKTNKTQDIIDYCDRLIENATKTKVQENRTASPENNPEKRAITPVNAKRKLFSNEGQESCARSSESLFSDKNNILRSDIWSDFEIGSSDDAFLDEEVSRFNQMKENKRITVLQDVVIKAKNLPTKINSDELVFSDVDDVVDVTPQKPTSSKRRNETFLEITLPPPLEFQDQRLMSQNSENDVTLVSTPKSNRSSQRLPLRPVNKITSTPYSEKKDSESVGISPITLSDKGRDLGPIDIVQKSASTPLTIIKKPASQKKILTPNIMKQNTILNYMISQESDNSQPSNSKPCIACSKLNSQQMAWANGLASKKLATYSASFSRKVTHLIVVVDEQNFVKYHTTKYISAVAAGIWVLNCKWVQKCLSENRIVPEEPYEVFDMQGVAGPRISRLTRRTSPLLKGFKVYMAPPFQTTTQNEMENVIRMLGGKVASSPEELLDKNGYHCVIIAEASSSQACDIFDTWMEALKVLTVDLEWLSLSVGQYKLLNMRPYTLCSSDSIGDLDYPSTPLSSSLSSR